MIREFIKQESSASGYLINKSKAVISCDGCDKEAEFLIFNPQLNRWEAKDFEWKEFFNFKGYRYFCCGRMLCRAKIFKLIILMAVEEASKYPGFHHYKK